VGGWTAFPLAYGYDDIEIAWRLRERFDTPVLYGVEAVRLFKQQAQKVPLVVLDVIMPKLNGPEAAALIRGAREDVRVLFTSGYTDAALAGSDQQEHLLQKPFEPDRLLRTVRQLLDGVPVA
jgi:CheY-like chemotaxis protein